MTLTRYLLDTIETEWPGSGPPSDLEFADANDSELLAGPIRTRTSRLEDAALIAVRHTSRDDIPGGAQVGSEREAVLRVQVEGVHEDEFGTIANHDDFRAIVRNSKEALRRVRYNPGVGDQHPATWVRLHIGPETGGSSAQADYYQTVYDVTLRGHES